MDGLFLKQDPAHDRASTGLDGYSVQKFFVLQVLLVSSSDPIACRVAIGSTVLGPPNVCHFRAAQARCGFDESVEYGLQIERRPADDLEHVSGGGLLLERLAQLVEQPRVFDCNHSLSGKIGYEFDLLIAENSRHFSVNDNDASRDSVSDQGHGQ